MNTNEEQYSVVATTNVVVVQVPFSTVIDGTTTVLTTEVSTTIGLPTDVGSSVTSVAESISSGLESLSSAASSLSSEVSAIVSGTTLITSVVEGSVTSTGTESFFLISSGTTIVSDGSTSIIPDVTISTSESVFTSVGSNSTLTTFVSTTGIIGNATATTGGGGEETPSETESGTGSTTSSPAAAANVKVPVQMGGLVVAVLVAIGLL
ncbi:hypothetical protein ABW19_dt0202120 [Dactylella cylindrospora]|nr:hypothetical protein ABW19_dt0202120 [Dactylella cylindrospora]